MIEGRDLQERSQPRELQEHEDEGHSFPGRWGNSHELRAGDWIITRSGTHAIITEIRQHFEPAFPVSNLTIFGHHNYSVGDVGVLVHNVSVCDGTIADLRKLRADGMSEDKINDWLRSKTDDNGNRLYNDDEIEKALGRILAPNSVQYDPNLVAGPNPNGLRQRAVTSPTAGEGGVYLKPHGGRTKVGSTGDFDGRYGPNAKPGIEVEIPQTRSGPPAGVDDSAYPWSARAQRRFDEEYIDRITPPDVRFRAPNARSPVDPDKWDRFRHIFGYGDLPSDFGF